MEILNEGGGGGASRMRDLVLCPIVDIGLQAIFSIYNYSVSLLTRCRHKLIVNSFIW